MAIAELMVRIKAQADQFNSQVQNMQQKLKGLGDSFYTTGKKATQYVTLPIVAAFTGIAKAAMDLEATEAKYNTVFEGMTETSDQFIKDFQKLTPATTAEARSMASGIQDLLVPMGFMRDEATGLTGEFMHVAGALANFNSGTHTAEQVTNAMQSAILGQYRPLAALGVQLDANTVQQKAYEMGLIDAGEEVTKQIATQVVLAEVYNQSGDALAAYTEENLDAKTRMGLMKAELIDVAAAFGNHLLPAIEKVVGWLRQGVEWFGSLSEGQQQTLLMVLALVAAIGPLLMVLGKIFAVVSTVIGIFTKVAAAIKVVGGVMGIVAGGPIVWIIAAIAALIAIGIAVWKNWDTIKEKAIAIWGSIKDFFSNLWGSIKTMAENIWNSIKDFFAEWGDVVLGVLMGPIGILVVLIRRNWDKIVEFTTNIWDSIKEFFSKFWEGLKEVFSKALQFVKDLFFKYHPLGWIIENWDKIKNFFGKTWENIKGIFTGGLGGTFDTIKDRFGAIFDFIRGIWDSIIGFFVNIWDNIKALFTGGLGGAFDVVKERFGAVFDFINKIWTTIRDFFSQVWERIKGIFSGGLSGIWEAVKKAFNDYQAFIQRTLQAIQNFLSGAWNSIRNAAVNAWNAIRNGVTTAAGNLSQGIRDTINRAIDFVRGLPGQMLQIGKDIIQGLINGIRNMAGNLGGAVRGVVDNAVSSAKKFLGIKSPSVVFEKEIGAEMGAGIAQGLDRAQGIIKSALQSATDPGSVAFGNMGHSSSAVGSGQHSRHIVEHVHSFKDVPDHMDEEKLADAIAEAFRKPGLQKTLDRVTASNIQRRMRPAGQGA